MATANTPIPPGFVRFQLYWINKLRQRLNAPFQQIGYDVLIKKEAEAFLNILSPYQLLAITQKLYSLAALPRSDEARHKKTPLINTIFPNPTRASASLMKSSPAGFMSRLSCPTRIPKGNIRKFQASIMSS